MNIWKILGTLINAIELTEVLLGEEVNTRDGVSLGVATDVKLNLMLNKVWVIVKNQGRWSTIPTEHNIIPFPR